MKKASYPSYMSVSPTLAEVQAAYNRASKLLAGALSVSTSLAAFVPPLDEETTRLKKLLAEMTAPGMGGPALTFSKRFGPTWKELNPTPGQELRPTLFCPPDVPAKRLNLDGSKATFLRADPYNVGIEDGDLNDYWSCSGQVAYVPDPGDMLTFPKAWLSPEKTTIPNPGIDRIATFAHYDGVFATSPRLDYASYISRPDHYRAHEGRYALAGQPVGLVRNAACLCNEALVITDNGYLMTAGTQTSREGDAWPLPLLILPTNKKPTGGIAITSGNEICLITVIDAGTGKGQLAVVALESKWIKFHAWPYIGLTSQGSWSDFKLLGFVDLSINSPDNVAAASNAYWESPGQTNGQSLSQIDLSDPKTRSGILAGEYGWTRTVATKGYAIVCSKTEDKAVVVDLTPVFAMFRNAWLVDYEATDAARGPGPDQFPKTFDQLPTSQPKEVYAVSAPKPSCVAAGARLERWTSDFHKAYIFTESGLVTILDTSSFMARYDFEQSRTVGVVGTFKVGKNPVAVCFSQFVEAGLPLIPPTGPVDSFNNLFWVACRGDRSLQQVVTFRGNGQVVRTLQDVRLEDPVGLGMADRAPVLSVADYTGRKVHSFRVGGLRAHSGARYGCGQTGTDYAEYCGALAFNGSPFAVNSVNVN